MEEGDISHQLEELHALTRDNHRMLRAIRRDQWFGFFGKIIFWAIMLALPFYLYNEYVAPIVAKVSDVKDSAGEAVQNPAFIQLQNLVKFFKSAK